MLCTVWREVSIYLLCCLLFVYLRFRPFYSAVSDIRSSQDWIFAIGNEDGSVIQFSPIQDN